MIIFITIIAIISILIFLVWPNSRKTNLEPDHNFGGDRIYFKFQKCFFCYRRKNNGIFTEKFVQPGYDEILWYYHPACLKTILENPESHEKYVDLALEITNQIEIDKEQRAKHRQNVEYSIMQAKSMHKKIYESKETKE